MEDCLFCMIAEGKIPSKKLYEDEQVVAFYSPEQSSVTRFSLSSSSIPPTLITSGRTLPPPSCI